MPAAHPTSETLASLGEFEPGAQCVLEMMGTARAVRYFERGDVPFNLLEALIWAATRASSPDNSQLWDFVVVTDQDVKDELARAVRPFLDTVATLGEATDAVRSRTRRGAVHLIEHFAEVPALIAVVGRNEYPAGAPDEKYLWGALHAASQNMVVAGRALGLSVVLTMLHIAAPGEIRRILEAPSEARIGSIMAVGRPARDFGPVTRRPVSEVLHRDRW